MLVAAVGCTAFVVLPYALNLWMAATIKRANGVLSKSPWAQQWFENNAKVFTMLVALTGGTYASLCLVSSNVFGLSVTSSGLTKFDLRRMVAIKVKTILLENVPQLAFQLLYAYELDAVTN